MAMFTVEPDAQTAEVYRNTPFEHLTTAPLIVTCAMPIRVIEAPETVQVAAPRPNWVPARSNAQRPTPAVGPVFEEPEWLSDLLNQVQFEMLEDATDLVAARKALANPKNRVRVPLDEVKKRLGL